MTKLKTLTAIAIAMGFAAPALAQTAGITADEYQAYGQSSFSQLDTDGDGMLSREEMQAGGMFNEEDLDALVILFDEDQDQMVSQDEYFSEQSYTAADANQDQMVDEEEGGGFWAALTETRGEIGMDSDDDTVYDSGTDSAEERSDGDEGE